MGQVGMAVAQGPLLVAVLLLVSSGLHCFSSPALCPDSCTCQRAPLLNCSSSGLSLVPQHIQDSVTELDLSHNFLSSVTLHRPHHNLRNVWLGNNAITHLSLCIESTLRSQFIRDIHLRRLRPWSRLGCVSWAPTLQLLSVERNQLEQLPEGLEGSGSLQVLQLSFNRISTLRPGDLSRLRQLKELHLQHNLIASLHSQMFQDLTQLKVLDLSFNMLTSLHPLIYLSLHTIGADVRLDGNRWQCDCSMRNLRRRMAYDSSRGLQTWSIVCASPSILSDKDLLQLEEDDLNCFSTENRPELHQDVTVNSGSEILLSCSTQDSLWWTPTGQSSVSQPLAGLLINDIKERDIGLYVCVSEEHDVVNVFNLQISKIGDTRRHTRSLPRSSQHIIGQDTANRIGQERNMRATQSELTLAVCLSVFITFLVAFILGVLARPCIDVLWKRVTNKKRSSAANSVSSTEQRQYDNEAFSSGEEPGEIPIYRERRVTFSTVDFREDNNVIYYDAVASGKQESINKDVGIEYEVAEEVTHKAGDSEGENTLRQTITEDNQKNGRDLSDITKAGHKHKIKFEHIPDPELEERKSLSSSSDSSLSSKVLEEDQMTQQDHTKPKSSQLANDFVQQRPDFSTATKVEVPQISIESRSEIPGFLDSKPFAEWTPHSNNTHPANLNLWQENEEQFEFSDSVRSTSSSLFGSFNDVAATSDKQKSDDMSSSSSYVSEDEPTQYTVNSDQEEEKADTRDKVTLDLGHITHTRRHLDIRAPSLSSDSSSSTDSEGETTCPTDRPGKGDIAELPFQESPSNFSKTHFPALDLEHIPHIERRLDFKAPLDFISSSSSNSEDEATYKTERPGKVDIAELPLQKSESHDQHENVPHINRGLDIKAPSPASDSSSSSDTEDEMTHHTETPVKVNIAELPLQKSQTSDDPEAWWSAVDLSNITRIKRRLDIKGPSPPPDLLLSGGSKMNRIEGKREEANQFSPYYSSSSSDEQEEDKPPSLPSDSCTSSDSVDETTSHTEKQRPEKLNILFKEPQSVSHDPDARWPILDLQHIPHIKRRLDIKAPSSPPDPSSNHKIMEEKMPQMKKQEQGEVHITKHPFIESEAESPDLETRWPALDLEKTTCFKRRLDIKASSSASDSSSHSDSEDETTCHIKKQEQGEICMARPSFTTSQTYDQATQWHVVDLEHTTRIKRRLDIRAPSADSDSSASSDSDDETADHTEKQRPSIVDITELPLNDPETKWPALDLQHTTRIKRRLDIKAPSQDSISSSSSDSDEEMLNRIKKQEQGEIHMVRLPVTTSQTYDPETQWPVLDLEHSTRIKRRLDIRAPSADSDSSASSDSDDETADHTEKQGPAKLDIAAIPQNDPDTRWPALDLDHLPHIKRRLDIKSPCPDLSSNIEIVEDKISQIKKHEQGEVHITKLPVQEFETTSHDPETKWPALDLQHTTRIKRRLDIKAPSQDSISSSSSDSDDEMLNRIKKQEQGEIHMVRLPVTTSQTSQTHDTETQWPVLDLEPSTRIKRRLDIQMLSPASDSSSTSDSDDETAEHTEKQGPAKLDITAIPQNDPDTRWPALDLDHLPHIKRRLDIKSPCPDLSSNIDIVEDKKSQIKKHEQGEGYITKHPIQKSKAENHDQEAKWPALDFEHTIHIKRRLDIKAPSQDPDSSSSSDSEDETINYTKKQRPGVMEIAGLPHQESHIRHDPETQWSALDLEHSTCIKRHQDIKAPSLASDSSSSSDSEDEMTHQTERAGKVNTVEFPCSQKSQTSDDPETQWPAVDLSTITRIKRRLDIKGPSPPPDSLLNGGSRMNRIEEKREEANQFSPYYSSSSSDEQEGAMENFNSHTIKVVPEPDPRLPELSIRSSNTSILNISRSPKIDHNIKLEKYTIITDDFREMPTSDHSNTTPEINPELQSRWATMNLGISRFRKRLEITSHKSPSSFTIETDGKGWRGTSRLPVVTDKGPSQNTLSKSETEKVERMARVELNSETPKVAVESDSVWPHLDLPSIPIVKRALDVKAPLQTESSFSSNSEDETIYHSVPDMTLGVPRIKRRLNIKAPSPEHSNSPSSCSENENEVTRYTAKGSRYASNMSGMTDNDSLITYKRLIMKASLPPSDSFSPNDKSQTTHHAEMVTVVQEDSSQGDRNTSLVPKKLPSISFDEIVKKKTDQSRSSAHEDLPPEIRWTGIGRHLSDLPNSRRRQDVDLSSPQHSPPAQPEGAPTDSFNFSSIKSHNKTKPDRGKEYVTQMQSYSALSANSTSLASSRALDHFDNSTSNTDKILRVLSEESKERKGLSALKAMSSARRKWDTEDENFNSASSLYNDPQGGTSFNNHRSEEDLRPLAKQPLTHLSSTLLVGRRAADVLYGIPNYRRNDVRDIEPPQEVPPPVPATPPPDEAVELAWKTP